MSIAAADLYEAFDWLHRTWETAGQGSRWKDVKVLSQFGQKFLRITMDFPSTPNEHKTTETSGRSASRNSRLDEASDDDDDNDDDGASVLKAEPHFAVTFDVIHSPSYEVPVLYFQFRNLPPNKSQPCLTTVHHLLVPELSRPVLRSGGILGGIGKAEHPVTGMAVYFVHPCRTTEALNGLHLDQLPDPNTYLMQWFGVIGASVGLDIPLQIATKCDVIGLCCDVRPDGAGKE